MTLPTSSPAERQTDPLTSIVDQLDAELKRDFNTVEPKPLYSNVNSAIRSTTYVDRGRVAAAPHRGGSERPPVNFTGPPHQTQILGPLHLLAEVAEHSRVVLDEVSDLKAALTGEAPQTRAAAGFPAAPAAGLLPRVAQLATEIDVVTSNIARLVEAMRRSLP